MSQSQVREPKSFGKRRECPSITITRNGKSRQYSVSPIYFSLLAGLIAMFSVGYFSATTYLVLRDDLISAHGARSARLQYEYEDRIAALRSSLDMITSRQLLDQQAVEKKVEKLIARQNEISRHNPTLAPVLEKAKALGLDTNGPKLDERVTGSIKREKHAGLIEPFSNGFYLRGLEKPQNDALSAKYSEQSSKLKSVSEQPNAPSKEKIINYRSNNGLFADIDKSILDIAAEHKKRIDAVRSSADQKLISIANLMKKVGMQISTTNRNPTNSQIGGPFVPLDLSAEFDSNLNSLEKSLSALEDARKKVDLVPVINPTPGKSISSRFGSRIDPFKRTYAMHAGYDFKAGLGTLVLATANGKVIFAGRNGGYGRMVEIRHANGLTTRYAHLSKILVKKGQTISAGAKIGKVGSTGRSTGPHLHYEIRKNDVAINPGKYLRIGRELANLL